MLVFPWLFIIPAEMLGAISSTMILVLGSKPWGFQMLGDNDLPHGRVSAPACTHPHRHGARAPTPHRLAGIAAAAPYQVRVPPYACVTRGGRVRSWRARVPRRSRQPPLTSRDTTPHLCYRARPSVNVAQR